MYVFANMMKNRVTVHFQTRRVCSIYIYIYVYVYVYVYTCRTRRLCGRQWG